MMADSPITSLVLALESALKNDLSDWIVRKGTDKAFMRRPMVDECEVYHFPQTWSDTSLGFGGIAGQAFTTAYTTVVISPSHEAAVYFAGRFAYLVKNINTKFYEDLSQFNMKRVREKGEYERTD